MAKTLDLANSTSEFAVPHKDTKLSKYLTALPAKIPLSAEYNKEEEVSWQVRREVDSSLQRTSKKISSPH